MSLRTSFFPLLSNFLLFPFPFLSISNLVCCSSCGGQVLSLSSSGFTVSSLLFCFCYSVLPQRMSFPFSNPISSSKADGYQFGGYFVARGNLAMSGYIFSCHNWDQGAFIHWHLMRGGSYTAPLDTMHKVVCLTHMRSPSGSQCQWSWSWEILLLTVIASHSSLHFNLSPVSKSEWFNPFPPDSFPAFYFPPAHSCTSYLAIFLYSVSIRSLHLIQSPSLPTFLQQLPQVSAVLAWTQDLWKYFS